MLETNKTNVVQPVVAELGGTLTGVVTGAMADITAVSTSGGNTYADSAINAKITAINLQLKELQSKLNAVINALSAKGDIKES